MLKLTPKLFQYLFIYLFLFLFVTHFDEWFFFHSKALVNYV